MRALAIVPLALTVMRKAFFARYQNQTTTKRGLVDCRLSSVVLRCHRTALVSHPSVQHRTALVPQPWPPVALLGPRQLASPSVRPFVDCYPKRHGSTRKCTSPAIWPKPGPLSRIYINTTLCASVPLARPLTC